MRNGPVPTNRPWSSSSTTPRPAATSPAAGSSAADTRSSKRQRVRRRCGRWRRGPWTLVILDVGLPDMSGFEVCELIKADPGSARPVIHLSATAVRGADRAQGLTRGADAYLVEPVEPDELLATVASVLRYYRARRRCRALRRPAEQAHRRDAGDAEGDGVRPAHHGDRRGRGRGSSASPLSRCSPRQTGGATRPSPGRRFPPRRSTPRAHVLADSRRAAGPRRRTAPPSGSLPAHLPAGTATTTVAGRAVGRTRGAPPGDRPCAWRRPGRPVDLLAQIGHAAVLAFDSLRLYTEEHTWR